MKDFEIRCDESRLERNHVNDTLYGKFTLGPFLPGQGTTFGNALRRSLLSELSGLAITSFEILGVMQEFSTLPGLRESVLDLSLNLKQVVLTGTLPYSTPPVGFLKIRGPAVIKAADLTLPAGVYCTSPNQYIATLSSNGVLNLKILVSVGKGYSTQPYSFYRSLSKIKMQPAFSITQKYAEGQADPLVKRMGKLETMQYASKPVTVDPKEINRPSRRQSTENLPNKIKEIEKGQKFSNNSANRSISLTNGTPLPGLKHTPKMEDLPMLQPDQFPGELESRQNEGEVKNFSVVGDTKNVFPKQSIDLVNKSDSKLSTPTLAKNPDFLNPSYATNTVATGVGDETAPDYIRLTEEGNKYVDVQAQIFQRIRPHQVLPIDAVFTPVSRVNFLTQINDRFETSRENIVLEIWTNGSIHPKRALEEATLSLVQNFDTLLKKIQQGSSFHKGLRYWDYLQSLDFDNDKASSQLSAYNFLAEKGIYKEDKSNMVTPLGSFVSQSEGTGHHREQSISQQKSFLSQREASAISEGMEKDSDTQSRRESSPVEKVEERKDFSNLNKDLSTLEMFPVNRKNENRTSSRKYLHQAIYNLDIGNLNLSLETFVLLKQANISTLSQLLTHFFPQKNKLVINSNIGPNLDLSKTLKDSFFLSEKIVTELKDVVSQFI